MDIAILETEHFEGAYPIIKLFDTPLNKITIYTNEKSYSQFKFLFPDEPDRYKWVVTRRNQSKYILLQYIYRDLKKNRSGILYLNTVNNNFIFYAVLVKRLHRIRVVLTLHNINTHFTHLTTFSARRLIRNAGKKMLIKAVQEFNVVSLTMVNYLKDKLPSYKKTHCLPGAIFEEEKLIKTAPEITQRINIVIPGSIDKKRRDYDIVFHFMNEVNLQRLPVHVTLLGGIYNDYSIQILEKCKKYALKNTNLKFYNTDIVDQPEFDRIMNDAHFVWVPSVIDTIISDNVSETYGVSKSSGNIFDIIKHAVPFFAPAILKVDPFLDKICLRYNSIHEIIAHLQRITNSPEDYGVLEEAALAASGNYTIDKVRERNPDLF